MNLVMQLKYVVNWLELKLDLDKKYIEDAVKKGNRERESSYRDEVELLESIIEKLKNIIADGSKKNTRGLRTPWPS